jgi:hypothetical protein
MMRLGFRALVVLGLAIASCAPAITSPPRVTGEVESSTPEATEVAEYTWNQLLMRDGIAPIYEPEFVPASEAGYDDDELVMGVAIDGEARAYPVGLLNGREMVNDELVTAVLYRSRARPDGERRGTGVWQSGCSLYECDDLVGS